MIPILYNADEQLYDSWGIGPLSEISNPRVVEEGNGLFYFTFDYPASSEMYKHLKNQNKVVADASPELENQVFVITRVTKPLRGVVSVYAEHISLYVTKNAGFSNTVHYNGNAQDALNAWQGALITEEDVYVSSDITMTSTGTWELEKVLHARKVLGGVEGSILDVYGGEYKFNNLLVSLMKSRGENRGVQINWGKNLVDLVDEEDLNRVNTAIEPFAKLYISEEDKKEMTEEEREEAENTIFWLPEQILFSKYSDMYHYQRVALIDLTNENITSVDDLRAKATAYMDRNNFGRPKIDTKISHVDLSKTIEFQDIAEFEAIDLFDTVTVNVEKYGITDLTAKVVEVDYNPVLERYNEIRIGNTLSTRFQENVGSVKKIEESQAERLAKIEREIIITQEIAGGGALIFRTEPNSSVTPIANNIGDTWYKKLGDGKTQIFVWNGVEWESILNLEELEYNIETAQSSAQTAIEEAEKATQEAVKAITGLEETNSTIAQITDGDVTAYNQKISTALGDIQTIKDADYATQISNVAGRINVQIVDNADGTKSMMDMTSNQLLYNIDGGKIQVTKDKFYMDQTLIVPIIQTTKLSATQIESGTFDANKANIINLNVANLVGQNADLVRGSFNAINTSINIDGTALTTKGNWGGDIKLSNRGLTLYDNLANREMGVLYGLFRNEDDPLKAQSMLATGLFANYGYKLNIGLRNQTNSVNYSVISLDTADTGKHQMNVFGDIIARYDLKMFGGMLTGAANAGYTVTEANGGHCFEFANGWKIQLWRSSYQTFTSGWTEWTFPKRFTSIPRVVLAQAMRDDENMANCNAYGFNYQACNIRIQDKTMPWTIVAMAIGR